MRSWVRSCIRFGMPAGTPNDRLAALEAARSAKRMTPVHLVDIAALAPTKSTKRTVSVLNVARIGCSRATSTKCTTLVTQPKLAGAAASAPRTYDLVSRDLLARDYAHRVDRDAIERRDFPVGRRGYDRAAVDAHLQRVAQELDALRARSPSPIAAGASDHVRAILDAAETSAAALSAEAGAHAARVEEAADGMLARLRELEGELGAVVAALHRSAEQLDAGLARLREQTGGTDAGVAEPPTLGQAGEPDALEEDFAAAAPADTDFAARPDGDEAGARLTALNMALSGTPREETARYLADHFAVADRDGLLDDVYARAGR